MRSVPFGSRRAGANGEPHTRGQQIPHRFFSSVKTSPIRSGEEEMRMFRTFDENVKFCHEELRAALSSLSPELLQLLASAIGCATAKVDLVFDELEGGLAASRKTAHDWARKKAPDAAPVERNQLRHVAYALVHLRAVYGDV